MNSEIHYSVPIHFLWGKLSYSSKYNSLYISELKGNYTDNQVHSLTIAMQPTISIFKLLTISATDCTICVKIHMNDITTIKQKCSYGGIFEITQKFAKKFYFKLKGLYILCWDFMQAVQNFTELRAP